MRKSIALIGAGNMGEALIRGILAASLVPASRLVAADVCSQRLEAITGCHGIRTTPDSASAAGEAQVILLAVKPHQISGVLNEIAQGIDASKLTISIAAGITTGRIEQELGGRPRVVRVMPNTPAQIGAGAAAIAGGSYATEEDLRVAETIMGAIGVTVRTEERFLDAVTALSGSGPAYVFLVAEAMIQSGMEIGLSPQVSRTLAIQTVLGAARLMAESGEDPALLRHKVTSPGGTTAAALKVMDEGRLVEVFGRAIKAAALRSQELSSS